MTKNLMIDQKCDISALYKSFSDSNFINDLQIVKSKFELLDNTLCEGFPSFQTQFPKFLDDLDDTLLLFANVSAFVNLNLLLNASHEEAQKYANLIASLQAQSYQIQNEVKLIMAKIENPFQWIFEDDLLKPYDFLIKESKLKSGHFLSKDHQKILSTLQITGSHAWQKLYTQLESKLTAEITLGDSLHCMPISQVRAMASDPLLEKRKSAYFAELKSYASVDHLMASCLNAIKGEGLSTAKLRGYSNTFEYMLDINRLDQPAFDAMMHSIEAHLPVLREYLKVKARLLGHSKGLPWYDLLAPIEKTNQAFTYEDSAAILVDAFTAFNIELGDLICDAIGNHWIDAASAVGKTSGALCLDFPYSKQHRAIVNFNGRFSDIKTIAHELGHAFHSRCQDGLPLITRDAPTPLCETASTFNEIVLSEYYRKTLTDLEKISFIEQELQDVTQLVLDIYSRYQFEKTVFEALEHHDLTPEMLCSLMKDSQIKAYGDALDPEFLHPYRWISKVHYYIPDFHYYNYPYTFGLLFAKGLYERYNSAPEPFMPQYKDLLRATGASDIRTTFIHAGIDIDDPVFWDASFRTVKRDVEWFVNYCNEQLLLNGAQKGNGASLV